MIHGIGTDIVEYARFKTMWERYGMRCAAHMLSEHELQELGGRVDKARFLAKRFAAKEAFAKAVGSGLRHPVSLTRIGVRHDNLGKPLLQFDDTLRRHLAQLGINCCHLSISDERSMIVAFVVLESC